METVGYETVGYDAQELGLVGAADDLADILRAVSGDPNAEAAIAALSPEVGRAVRKAKHRSRERVVLGNAASGRGLNTMLPVTNGSNAVAASASVALTGTPLRNFKPNQLVVQTDGVAVTVDTVTVANIPQFASAAGQAAVDAFKNNTVRPYMMDWDVIPLNQSIIATCTNRHAATACAIFGSVYGKYTQA